MQLKKHHKLAGFLVLFLLCLSTALALDLTIDVEKTFPLLIKIEISKDEKNVDISIINNSTSPVILDKEILQKLRITWCYDSKKLFYHSGLVGGYSTSFEEPTAQLIRDELGKRFITLAVQKSISMQLPLRDVYAECIEKKFTLTTDSSLDIQVYSQMGLAVGVMKDKKAVYDEGLSSVSFQSNSVRLRSIPKD